MSNKLNSISYQKLYDELINTKKWLNSKRINTINTRFEEILNTVKEINEHYKSNTLNSIIEKKGNEQLWFSLLESNAFTLIYESFKDLKDHDLPRNKLRCSLQGPFLPREEVTGESNVNNRNLLFELELAAKLKSKGIDITGFDDIKFYHDSVEFVVECKRISSKKSVKSNISKAHDQIKQSMKNKNNIKGIIALSVEKLFKTDEYILKVETEDEIKDKVSQILNYFIRENKKYWDNIIDIRIVSIFIVLKFIAIIKSKRNMLTSGFQIDIVPLCSPQSLQFCDYNLLMSLGKQLSP